ncbi:GTPase [Williamsia sp. CHRR-6]|uniref:GTPase n=1 Tax=Williamsia sp. CHRR-6 TaxID=2835871 RepID=UPI001BDB47FC|nr:GTPase [Williamsia sp. CHRR-6]MBT0566087.1 50S ribosome-binding GTPase [Williamsia sp. CHRR-6]
MGEVAGLADAVNEAVRTGERELQQLELSVEAALQQLREVALSDSGERDQLLADLSAFTDAFAEKVRRHLDDQRQILSTFNIVFFGRTGAGKSTLLSAFGQLDGLLVSPGDSDWTTEVMPIEWQRCSLWDTPGINGWGRTRARSELEETARRAVEIADVVLLCFDTQSQQSSEFGKIAEWVKAYGKPTIAVLNVRNLRWRHPAKVQSQSVRRSLSRAVAEHANNIRTELAKIELGGTPVVAIQSRRALFARAATPFRGPASNDLASDRELFGTEYLAQWSNFSALEDLVAASITEGGMELRQTSLREGLRAIVASYVSKLSKSREEVEPQIRVIENRLEQLFDTLGYLEEAEREVFLQDGADLISAVESERGRPFTASRGGTFDRHFNQLLESHLLQAREGALRRADVLVSETIAKNSPLTDSDFQRAVYSTSELQAATDEIWSARKEFLQREIQLAVSEIDPGLSEYMIKGMSFDAISSAKAKAGLALQSAGLAAGAVSGAIAVPSVASIWNPVGWVGTSVAIGLGVGSQVGKFAGSRLAKSGEDETASRRATAAHEARAAVHETFDAIEEKLRNRSRAETWRVAAPVLIELLQQSLAIRRGRAKATRLIDILEAQSRGIAEAPSSTGLLDSAAARVLDSRGARSRGGAEVWLGENWFEATDGGSTQPPKIVEAHRAIFATQMEQERIQLGRWLSSAWSIPPDHEVRAWFTAVGEAMSNDDELSHEVNRARNGTRSKPAVAILGDYSAGKSSLVKRLLVEMSGSAPPDLGVRGSVSTNAARTYELGHIRLIDTPGFQSGRANHDEQALAAAAGAALVVVVVHVNLLLGDVTLLEAIVNGTARTVPKAGRIIFLINRSDELGVDPTSDPEAYLLLRRRKSTELIAALGSRGIALNESEVHTVAGDPFGEVGNNLDVTRADYDGNREWDGIEPVVRTLDSFSRKLSLAGRERAAIDETINALLSRREDLRANVAELEAEVAVLARPVQAFANGESAAELLESAMRNKLTQIVDPFVEKARGRIRSAGSEDLDKVAESATAWLDDPQLTLELDRFTTLIGQDIDDWYAEHSSTISRQLGSLYSERNAALADEKFSAPKRASGVDSMKIVAGSANGAAKVARLVGNRDTVYAIGKNLGVKFKPWGAVKASSRVAKAAPILAAIGTAADARAMYNAQKSAKGRDKLREDAIGFLAESFEKIQLELLEGDGSTGPVPALRDRRVVLAEQRAALEATRERLADDADSMLAEVDVISSLLDRATELLSSRRSGE